MRKTNKMQLMRRYNWSLTDPLKFPKLENPNIWIIHDFWVKIERRLDEPRTVT